MTDAGTLPRAPASSFDAMHSSAAAVASLLPEPQSYRYRLSDIADVLRRWGFGHDSAAIAATTGIPEADVCRIIAVDQDRRQAIRARRAAETLASRQTPF